MFAAGRQITALHVAEWKSELIELLRVLSADDGPKPASEKKVARLATYDLVCSLDWQLQLAGVGLKQFLPMKSDSLTPIHQRYRMTVITDTPTENMSQASYLLNKRRARVMYVPDPIHRLFRGLWRGVVQAGKYSSVILSHILATGPNGPFKSKKNLTELREEFTEYIGMTQHRTD